MLLRVGDGLPPTFLGENVVGRDVLCEAAFPEGALKEAAEREALLERGDDGVEAAEVRRHRLIAQVGRRRVVLRRHHEAVGLGRDAVAVELVDLRHREQRAPPGRRRLVRPVRRPQAPLAAAFGRLRLRSEQRHELGGQRRLARRRRRGEEGGVRVRERDARHVVDAHDAQPRLRLRGAGADERRAQRGPGRRPRARRS